MKALIARAFATARGVDETLAGAKAARIQVWLFLAPLFTLFTYLAFRDPLPISAPNLLAIAAAAQAISLVTYALTRPIVVHRARLSRGSARLSTGILFAWYVLFSVPGEIFKATQIGLTGEWIADHPVIWLSTPTSCLVAATWTVLSNLTVNWVFAARSVLGELRGAEARLENDRQRLKSRLAEDLQQLREQVTTALLPAIENLRIKVQSQQSVADSALLKSAAEITDFCDTEVRAMSHTLAVEQERGQLPQVSSRVGLVTAVATIVRHGDVSLNRMFAVMLTLAVPYAIDSAGYQALIVTVVGLSLGFLVLRLVDPARRRLFGSKGAASFVSALVMYLAVSALGVWVLNLGLPLYPSLWDFADTLTWLLPGILVLVWLILGFVFGADNVVRLAADRISAANRALTVENERLLAQTSAARNRIYRLLHGSVQGRLAAVSLALTAIVAEADAAKRDALLAQANEQMALAEADLRGAFDRQQPAVPAETRLTELTQAWRNLMTIEVQAAPNALVALDANGRLGDEVLSAIQEGVTNAHRHGSASRVEVTLRLEDGVANLTIRNDGREGHEGSTDGTGLERIALGASSVKFDRGQDYAILTATWKLTD